ncbi:MAG: BatA domain-containing protein [Verrucomicrobiales bacterium]
MQFLSPAFLYLGFLALIPVALYLFRRKARVKQVSTLVFFKTLAREHQESAWLRVKRILSAAHDPDDSVGSGSGTLPGGLHAPHG